MESGYVWSGDQTGIKRKKKVKRLSSSNLKDVLKKKIIECVVYKEELGKIRRECLHYKKNQQSYEKKTIDLYHQIRDISHTHKTHIADGLKTVVRKEVECRDISTQVVFKDKEAETLKEKKTNSILDNVVIIHDNNNDQDTSKTTAEKNPSENQSTSEEILVLKEPTKKVNESTPLIKDKTDNITRSKEDIPDKYNNQNRKHSNSTLSTNDVQTGKIRSEKNLQNPKMPFVNSQADKTIKLKRKLPTSASTAKDIPATKKLAYKDTPGIQQLPGISKKQSLPVESSNLQQQNSVSPSTAIDVPAAKKHAYKNTTGIQKLPGISKKQSLSMESFNKKKGLFPSEEIIAVKTRNPPIPSVDLTKKKKLLMSSSGANDIQPPTKKFQVSSASMLFTKVFKEKNLLNYNSTTKDPSQGLNYNKYPGLGFIENPEISDLPNQGNPPKESTYEHLVSPSDSICKPKAKKQFSWVSVEDLNALEQLNAPEHLNDHEHLNAPEQSLLADNPSKSSEIPKYNDSTKILTTMENNEKSQDLSKHKSPMKKLMKEAWQVNQNHKDQTNVTTTKDKSNVYMKAHTAKAALSTDNATRSKVLIRKPVKLSLTSSPYEDTNKSAEANNPCETTKQKTEIPIMLKNKSPSYTEGIKKLSDLEEASAINKNFNTFNKTLTVYKESTAFSDSTNTNNKESTTSNKKIMAIKKKSTKTNLDTTAINDQKIIKKLPTTTNDASDLDNHDHSLVNLSDIDDDQDILSKKIAAKNGPVHVNTNDDVIIDEDFTINVPELDQNIRTLQANIPSATNNNKPKSIDKNKVITLRPISSLLKSPNVHQTAPSQIVSNIKVKCLNDLVGPEHNYLKQQLANAQPKMTTTVQPIVGQMIPIGQHQIVPVQIPGHSSRHMIVPTNKGLGGSSNESPQSCSIPGTSANVTNRLQIVPPQQIMPFTLKYERIEGVQIYQQGNPSNQLSGQTVNQPHSTSLPTNQLICQPVNQVNTTSKPLYQQSAQSIYQPNIQHHQPSFTIRPFIQQNQPQQQLSGQHLNQVHRKPTNQQSSRNYQQPNIAKVNDIDETSDAQDPTIPPQSNILSRQPVIIPKRSPGLIMDAPDLRVDRIDQGIQLRWDHGPANLVGNITDYQVCCRITNHKTGLLTKWRNISAVKAQRLPMVITLQQFARDSTYEFKVIPVTTRTNLTCPASDTVRVVL